MTVKEKAEKMKQVSPLLAASPIRARNYALSLIAESLRTHASDIFAANKADIRAAKNLGLAEPVIKRMTFNEAKLKSALDGIFGLIELPDPVGKTLLHRQLDRDLELYRITCPIGVIGVIFEARPDALVQISSLCIKSGNCALLKSGHETIETNRILFNIISTAAVKAGLPEGCLVHAEERSEISELLECDESVDLIIPRGSNAFVRYIMDNTRIPVMGHSDGVCHIYVSKNAKPDMALKIIKDAKTQYVAVCNAVETVLLDEAISDSFLPELEKAMADAHVELIME
ncbi:MAG: glutamate-5-semialdehyde dehydrogenase, partial [Lachnospiraceae bacterium]|nr:glutamate-5-semialdehyde dehydrogenase [Lachnospiraceae bacterium]